MNLKHALYIKTIAEERSISSAAKKLYISQPSLSQMLSSIESELGVTLFDRSHKDFRPTPAGECYISFAKNALNTDELFHNAIQEFRDNKRGKLRLGISRQRCAYILPSVLSYYLEKYPLINLELTEGGSNNLIRSLLENEIDIAFATTEAVNPKIDYQLIKRERVGILAGKGSFLADNYPSGTAITIDDCSTGKFVLLKPGHNLRNTQNEALQNSSTEPNIILETDSMEIARAVATSCGLYTICSDFTIRPGEYFYPISTYNSKYQFYACTRKDHTIPRYMVDFIESVKEFFKPHATFV